MSANQHTASVLAIGSELLLGQTVNGNATWLSKQLAGLGLETKFHLTVADARNEMHEALHRCATKTDLIFITGGLGPTSDDFTREVVAEHLGAHLEWNEDAWLWVHNRMSSRQLVVRDIQKQQCYFPKGATILVNDQGTAHGFYCQADRDGNRRHYFVLPGPPREVMAVWNSKIPELIGEICQGIDRRQTRLWDVIGLGESEVAHLMEPLLSKLTPEIFNSIEVGYRVHLPYVEFKLIYRQSLEPSLTPLFGQIHEALKPHLLASNGEDVVNFFSRHLPKNENFLICDEVSEGFLLQRLVAVLKSTIPPGLNYASSSSSFSDGRVGLRMSLRWLNNTEAEVHFTHGKNVRLEKFSFSNSSEFMRERAKQYFAEQALSFWAKALQDCRKEKSIDDR